MNHIDRESLLLGVMLSFLVQVFYDAWRNYYAQVWPTIPASWAILLSCLIVMLILGHLTSSSKSGRIVLRVSLGASALLSCGLALFSILTHAPIIETVELVLGTMFFIGWLIWVSRKKKR